MCFKLVLFWIALHLSSSVVLGYPLTKRPSPSHFSMFPRASTLAARPASKAELFEGSVKLALSRVESARAMAQNLTLWHHKAPAKSPPSSIADCLELFDDTIDLLANVISCGGGGTARGCEPDDVETWLSASLTNQETCLDSLQEVNNVPESHADMMRTISHNISHSLNHTLALYTSTRPPEAVSWHQRRALLSSTLPHWVSSTDRKLLEAPVEEIKASTVVSKDGTGTHETIGEALRFARALRAKEGGGSKGRTVIYVKAGTYKENLKIPSKQKNVMLVGDGKGKTVIVSNRNAKDGWTTFQSATVAAMGAGFMSRDITFVNNAGPDKHQAVALRVGSDRSVMYRCSILGYQDTLYTHSKRQFYRETDIYGTVDFIFGNSAVVFQKCNIYARKPLSGQLNFVTAQGRTSPYQNTGISIHDCKIGAASDSVPLECKPTTFLGRPWKQYSRTVVMQSFLDGSIHPLGWSPWSGDFALKTLFYGEYQNSGPGASITGRVKWASYHGSLTSAQAQPFTVAQFISGNSWLPSTGVSFDSGLIG
ncbi:hypothetical protein BT93_K1480 [Corymbia citriodora subsp. variegata]|nr:hypothetical protein BT93_K1480 [Corymbia citriodora subsp. variegata]